MTTVREARIEAAYNAILATDPWISYQTMKDIAENVVVALFRPDPLIDNAEVPRNE